MNARVYMSSIERLRLLPEVFTGSELTVLFGWKSAIASNYIANWKRARLIKALGGRSDVFMNLLRNVAVNPETAMRRAFPDAVKLGVDVLRAAGWTTQIPSKSEVAVGAGSRAYSVDGFDITTRPASWFASVRPGVEISADGLDRLKPEWALADMIYRAQDGRVRNAWLMDPGDLDLANVLTSKELPKALAGLGLPKDCLDGDGYETLYQQFNARQRRPHPGPHRVEPDHL